MGEAKNIYFTCLNPYIEDALSEKKTVD